MENENFHQEGQEIEQLSLFEDEELGEKPVEKVSVLSPGVIGVLKNIGSWALTIVLAFIIAIIINTYIIRASEVHGASMQPTLQQGDVVFISRLPYVFSQPKHGDIVVFDSTLKKRNFLVEVQESLKYNLVSQKLLKIKGTSDYYIKRVIGVPGDLLEVKDGALYRNGEELKEDYINKSTDALYNKDFSITIKEGHIFCMGDNRNNSRDSRDSAIGQIPMNDILGKVVIGG